MELTSHVEFAYTRPQPMNNKNNSEIGPPQTAGLPNNFNSKGNNQLLENNSKVIARDVMEEVK